MSWHRVLPLSRVLRRPSRRVLLKLSGEAFGGESGSGINVAAIAQFAEQIKRAHARGIQIAVVVGGGNIVRGVELAKFGVSRGAADKAGMLSTVTNALILKELLDQIGVPTRVQTAIGMDQIAEPYIPGRAIRHLQKRRVVIFAAGLGAAFFSTDTAAAQRALDIGADIVLKATNADGVYDKDPREHPEAKRYDRVNYGTVLELHLAVMDLTAITLCMDHGLPIVVFSQSGDNISKALTGDSTLGTLVCEGGIRDPRLARRR